VPGDERENEVRCTAGKPQHAQAEILAVACENRIRIRLEARVDLSAVAPRCALSDLTGLAQHDADAPLGETQRGGEAGEAAADNENPGAPLTLQRRRPGAGGRGVPIEVQKRLPNLIPMIRGFVG